MSDSHSVESSSGHGSHSTGRIPDSTLLESVNEIRDMLTEILSMTRSNSVVSSYPPSSTQGSELHDDLITVFAEEITTLSLDDLRNTIANKIPPSRYISTSLNDVSPSLPIHVVGSEVAPSYGYQYSSDGYSVSAPDMFNSDMTGYDHQPGSNLTERETEYHAKDQVLESRRTTADREGSFLAPTPDHNCVYKLEFSDLESLSNVSDHETTGEAIDFFISGTGDDICGDGLCLNNHFCCSRYVNPRYDTVDDALNPLSYADSEEEFLTAPASLFGSRDSLITAYPVKSYLSDVKTSKKERDVSWMVGKVERLLKSDRVISGNVKHIRNCLSQLTESRDHPNVS